MKTKEKAKELYDKYWALIAYKIEGSVGRLVIKQCALIAVDEILKENLELPDLPETIIRYLYWQEVKQEIENL
jgi:hypothetical protein